MCTFFERAHARERLSTDTVGEPCPCPALVSRQRCPGHFQVPEHSDSINTRPNNGGGAHAAPRGGPTPNPTHRQTNLSAGGRRHTGNTSGNTCSHMRGLVTGGRKPTRRVRTLMWCTRTLLQKVRPKKIAITDSNVFGEPPAEYPRWKVERRVARPRFPGTSFVPRMPFLRNGTRCMVLVSGNMPDSQPRFLRNAVGPRATDPRGSWEPWLGPGHGAVEP
jgi:hypothetical protein